MKYTKGPWRITEHPEKGQVMIYGIGAGRILSHPEYLPTVVCTDEFDVVEISTDRSYGYPEGGIKSLADARLIAAAPELLEALKDLKASQSGGDKLCGHKYNCICTWMRAEEAISKAEDAV